MSIDRLASFIERHREAARIVLWQRSATGGAIRLGQWAAPFPETAAADIHDRATDDASAFSGRLGYSVEAFGEDNGSRGKWTFFLDGGAESPPAVADSRSVVDGQQAFIYKLLELLIRQHERAMGDINTLTKTLLGGLERTHEQMAGLQETMRGLGQRREEGEILRAQLELERIKLQGEQKERETERAIEADTQERVVNTMQSMIMGGLGGANLGTAGQLLAGLSGEQMAAIMSALTPEQQMLLNQLHATAVSPPAPPNGSSSK